MNGSPLYSGFLALILMTSCAPASYLNEKNKIQQIVQSNPRIQGILDSFSKYEAQIIYTQINRDQHNHPTFKSFYWNFQPDHYFYPASMVKMPGALIAAEKINQLSKNYPGLNLFTSMKIDSTRPPQTPVWADSTAWNHSASIGQYIKKIFIVSDNDAFNRLYEFVGQEYLNVRLQNLGYQHTHIIHRLDAPQFNYQSNKYTNPVHFSEEDLTFYQQPEQYNPSDVRVHPLLSTIKGQGYLSGDSLIHQPFDFGYKNYFSLGDMSTMIKNILFHEYAASKNRFDVTPEQLKYIRKCMSTLPSESRYPVYDTTHHDGYCKFFMFGDNKAHMPEHIRIFNKVGWAYGFLTDAAYIVDFKNKTEFILAATINTNTDGIYNDGVYEYESIGLPYLSQLGNLFYHYELNRPKKHVPDLTGFIYDYKE